MDYQTYILTAAEKRYEEYPLAIWAGQMELKHFIRYRETTNELKIHLAKVILCRNFSPVGGHCVLTDHDWFIRQFLDEFKADIIRPIDSDIIISAMEMIASEDVYNNQIIGTTIMFGVVEHHAKHLLGWRSLTDEFANPEITKKYRSMTLSDALDKLKKTKSKIGKILNEIDKQSSNRIKERRIIIKKDSELISQRLKEARNPMLHGEHYVFPHIGKYLCMLYILFHLSYEQT